MECRESLFWTPPPFAANGVAKPPPLMPLQSTRYRQLQTPSPSNASLLPNKPPEPVALPIPKNLVLLTMMEAAEQQARLLDFRKDDAIVDCDDCDDDSDCGVQDDVAQQQCARLGIGALSGSCGTYAVREIDGLAVLPFDPRRRGNLPAEEKKSDDAREPFTIFHGQTVQVVHFDDGVAKLAREEGFIVASEQQLVKGEFVIFCFYAIPPVWCFVNFD